MRAVGILLACLLFLAGCGGNSDTGTVDTSSPFVGGDRGLDVDFVEGAPPPEVFDNNQFPFSIAVKLSNVGETDVFTGDGYVEITGINPVDFGLGGQIDLKRPLPEKLSRSRKTSTGTVILGDIGIVEFNELNYQPNVHGNFDGARIRANLCYNYATRASSKVCVKEDLLTNIDNEDICKLSGNKPVSNSGGPIHITTVAQEPLGSNKIQVRFRIEHVGGKTERFFKPDTDCLDRPTNPNRDVVFVEVLSDVGGSDAQCSGLQGGGSSGHITLFAGAPRDVICTFDVSAVQGEFEELFEVGIKYRYFQFSEVPMLIRDVSVGDD